MRHPPARRSLSLPVAGTPPLPSLNAVAATGLGTTYNTQRAFSNWEVQISTTASPTFSVQLQGSLDGQAIINIGSPITATGLTNVTSNTPLTMVALNLTALSGGTLTGTIAGTESPAGAGGGGGGGAVTQSTGAGAAAPWSVELSDGAAFYTGTKTGQLPAALVGGRLSTDGSGVTQPVSGTVTANAGTGTLAVSAASLPLPTNAAQDRTTAAAPASVELSDGAAFYTGTKTGQLPAALVGGRLDVNIGATGVTQPVSGTVTGNQGTANTAANAWPAKVTDGTNVAAVKAASTAAIATDPAAVVTLSPNTALPAGANALGSVTVTGTPAISGTVTANQGTQGAGGTASWPVQGAAAAGAAVAGNPVRVGISDGTNTQDWKQAPNAATGQAATGIGTVASMLFNGAGDYRNIVNVLNVVDGNTGSLIQPVAPVLFGGSAYERQRNNVDVTLLASAARTTTQTSADIITYNCQGIAVTLDVTATVSTVSLTVTINYKDPASGKYITLLSSAVIAAASTTMLIVDPRVVAAANLAAMKPIGRTFQIVVTVGNANSQTYSVGYTLIPG